MSKKSIAVTLFILFLSAPAFAVPQPGRDPGERQRAWLTRLVQVVKRFVPISLGPDITVPNPSPSGNTP